MNEKCRRLVRMLDSDDLHQRKRAMRSLKKRSMYPCLEWVLDNDSTSDYAKYLVCEILFRTSWPEAIPALTRQLESKNASVRASAIEALGNMGIAAVSAGPRIIDLLTDLSQPVEVQDRAASTLGDIGYREAGEALLARIRDPEWTVRYNAIWALGTLSTLR